MTPVTIGSEIYGDAPGVATEVTERWLTVRTADPPPMRSVVTVHFPGIFARAEVRIRYFFNLGDGVWVGARLRVLEWLDSDVLKGWRDRG